MNNFWNTTDPGVIAGMIFDQNDDLASGGIISFPAVPHRARQRNSLSPIAVQRGPAPPKWRLIFFTAGQTWSGQRAPI